MTVYQQKLGPNFAVWPVCVDSILFDHDGFSIRQSECVDGGSYGGKETFNKSRGFLVIFLVTVDDGKLPTQPKFRIWVSPFKMAPKMHFRYLSYI